MVDSKNEPTDAESVNFLRVLASAALHPGLRSVVLFDATPEQVTSVAAILADLLEAATGRPAQQVPLTWYHNEDDLWGVGEDLPAPWKRTGLLCQRTDDPSWRLIVIPDLTRLNLAGLRACLQTVGADYVALERYGQSRTWQPRLLWLVGCARGAVGKVSPHLIDRFALRWTCRPEHMQLDRSSALRGWLDCVAPGKSPELGPWKDRLRRCRGHMPRITAPALEKVNLYLADVMSPGLRRHLSLARLAATLAWLDKATEVDAGRVDDAAGLLGLRPAGSATEPQPTTEQRREAPAPEAEQTTSDSQDKSAAAPGLSDSSTESPGFTEGTADEGKGQPVEVPESRTGPEIVEQLDPWPELRAAVEREFASLQPPIAHAGQRVEGGGRPIGVRPTSDIREVAVLPTLLAAAPFQRVRRQVMGLDKHSPDCFVEEMDLRAWRRSPVPQEILVMVLDATSYGCSDWPSALVPYVRRAYIDRSTVCLVLVGAAAAEDELRAERIEVRSVLVPELQCALDRGPGRATPLADGLQLALETLRKALQHGRGAVRQAQLVVLSDGRGNVPLDVSRGEPIVRPVGERGVVDALKVAREMTQLNNVTSVLLDPQARYGRHLTRALADALGARVESIPREMPQKEQA